MLSRIPFEPPRLSQDRRRRHARRARGRRGSPASGRRCQAAQGHGRHGDRAVDGRRHGAHRDVRSQAVHAVRPRACRPKRVLSTFPAIDTAVDNIKISRGAGEDRAGDGPRHADSLVHGRAIWASFLHSRHQYHWHTGYAPPQTVAAPHIGCVVARTLGPLNPAVPAFIDIGQRFDLRRRRGAEGLSHGRLSGQRVRPVPDSAIPTRPMASVRPPHGMRAGPLRKPLHSSTRSSRLSSPVGQLGSDYQQESLLRSLDNAHRLLSSPAAKAFDLEPGTEGKLRPLQHGPLRPGLPAGPPADGSRARASSR